MAQFLKLLQEYISFPFSEKIDMQISFSASAFSKFSQIKKAVEAGIRKINFGTDVCFSFLDAVFGVDRKTYAIDLFMKEPIEAVKKFAESKIELLGAKDRV